MLKEKDAIEIFKQPYKNAVQSYTYNASAERSYDATHTTTSRMFDYEMGRSRGFIDALLWVLSCVYEEDEDTTVEELLMED